mgnify:CR=1 FL=1
MKKQPSKKGIEGKQPKETSGAQESGTKKKRMTPVESIKCPC